MWGEAPVDHQLLWPFIPSTSLKQSSIALMTSGGSVQGITTLRKLGVVPAMKALVHAGHDHFSQAYPFQTS